MTTDRISLGGLTCFPLDGGRLQLQVPLAKTFRLELAMRPLLVQGRGFLALLDCGAGEVEPALAARFGVVLPYLPLVGQLAALGIRPADVDLLVLSHLHFDHAGGALAGGESAFPRADLLIQESEWRAGLGRGPGGMAARLRDAWPAGKIRLLSGDGQIVPGLEGWLTPGHTPGLMTVRIVGESAEALYPSDLLPMARSLGLALDRFSDVDPELALRQRRRVVAHLLGSGAIAFYSHDPARACSLAAPRLRGEGARPAALARSAG